MVQSLFALSEVEGLPLWLDRPRETAVNSLPLFSAFSAPLRFGFFSPLERLSHSSPARESIHEAWLAADRRKSRLRNKNTTCCIDTGLAFKSNLVTPPHALLPEPFRPSKLISTISDCVPTRIGGPHVPTPDDVYTIIFPNA